MKRKKKALHGEDVREVPVLSELGQKRWTLWLESQGGNSDNLKAITLPNLADTSWGPESSRFRRGHHDALSRTFSSPARLAAIAKALRTTPEAMWAALEQAAAESRKVHAPWHPAFPSVRSGEVAVTAPAFFWRRGRDAKSKEPTREEVIEDVRKAGPACIWVAPEPGTRATGASTLAQQLGAELGVEPIEAEPPGGWKAWRMQLAVKAVAVTGVDSWELDERDWIARPRPWSKDEVSALAGRLAPLLDEPDEERLASVARVIDEKPALLGPSPWPSTVIAALRNFMRDGAPKDVRTTWRKSSRIAWDAARALPNAERLALLEASFIERFWAERWLMAKGDWTRMSRADAVAAAEQARGMATLEPAEIASQIEKAKGERSKDARDEALAGITELLVGPSELIVDALIAGRLLFETAGDVLVPGDTVLARVWIALGLGAKPSQRLARHHQRLVDRDWPQIAAAIPHGDAEVSGVLALVDLVPGAFKIDAADGLMHALVGYEPKALAGCGELVIRIWAIAVWASAQDRRQHSFFGMSLSGVAEPVSERMRYLLPRLDGPDYFGALTKHVPPEVSGLFELSVDEHGARQHSVMTDAPFQAIPWTWSDWHALRQRNWPGPMLCGWIEELATKAKDGDPSGEPEALRMLCPRFDDFERVRLWEQLPRDVRWRWLGMNKEPDWYLWQQLVTAGTEGTAEERLAVLRRFGRDAVSLRFLWRLEQLACRWPRGTRSVARDSDDVTDEFAIYWHANERLDDVLDWAIALDLDGVLAAFVDAPQRWLDSLSFESKDGQLIWRVATRAGIQRAPTTSAAKVLRDELEELCSKAVRAARTLHAQGCPEMLHAVWRGFDLVVGDGLDRRWRMAQGFQYLVTHPLDWQHWPPASEAVKAEIDERLRGKLEIELDWLRRYMQRARASWREGAEARPNERVAAALGKLHESEINESTWLLGWVLWRIEDGWFTGRESEAWIGRRQSDFKSSFKLGDLIESTRMYAEDALIDLHDDVLWENADRKWLWRALERHDVWRERAYRRLGPELWILRKVPPGEEPAWFWEELPKLGTMERVMVLQGRALASTEGRTQIELQAREALRRDRVREAALWASLAACDGVWIDSVGEILKRWMIDDPSPWSGGPWFTLPRTSESELNVVDGWQALLALAVDWPQLKTMDWVREGVRRLWELPRWPDQEQRSEYPWEELNYGARDSPRPEDQIMALVHRVDLRSACDSLWDRARAREMGSTYRTESTKIADWRLRDVEGPALLALLADARWAPYAARKLVAHNDERGRAWLLQRTPRIPPEPGSDLAWEVIKECLPNVAIEVLRGWFAQAETRQDALDILNRQWGWDVHEDVRTLLNVTEREVFTRAGH